MTAGLPQRLVARHGGPAPALALCLVLIVALGLRVDFAKNHIGKPTPDARGYARIAEILYEDGTFGRTGDLGNGVNPRPSDYSPGVSLLAAGVYYAAGGVKPLLARLAVALLGTVAVYLTFLIGRRLYKSGIRKRLPGVPPTSGQDQSASTGTSSLARASWAGVIAAALLATYPALLEYHGMLISEPLAIFFLSGAVLSFLWAGEQKTARAWALPGLFFGLTALTRPEYLLIAVAFGVLAALRLARDGQTWRPRLLAAGVFAAALVLPIVPWTIHNAVSLNRFVPISTGGGKAFYIGTYEPGHGQDDQTTTQLLRREPQIREELQAQPERPITLDLILPELMRREQPGLTLDKALAKEGRHNFWHYWTSQPADYAWMYVGKVWHMWRIGPRRTMTLPAWRVLHLAIVVLAAAGLIMLAVRRRWEALVLAVLIVGITLESALLLAEPRRTLVLMPVLCALAGAALVSFGAREDADG